MTLSQFGRTNVDVRQELCLFIVLLMWKETATVFIIAQVNTDDAKR